MKPIKSKFFILLLFANLSIPVVLADTIEALEEDVFDAEAGFARTMADRDFAAFSEYIAEDAVFIGEQKLRGKQAIVAGWQSFFSQSEAPFSWQPETVVVIGSGDLALSSGPVRNNAGKIFAYFHSTWRRESGGQWKIVLDKGHPYCAKQENTKDSAAQR